MAAEASHGTVSVTDGCPLPFAVAGFVRRMSSQLSCAETSCQCCGRAAAGRRFPAIFSFGLTVGTVLFLSAGTTHFRDRHDAAIRCPGKQVLRRHRIMSRALGLEMIFGMPRRQVGDPGIEAQPGDRTPPGGPNAAHRQAKAAG